MELKLRYELKVIDEDTEEVIHQDTALTQESLLEKLYKADLSIAEYVAQQEAEKTNEEENEQI